MVTNGCRDGKRVSVPSPVSSNAAITCRSSPCSNRRFSLRFSVWSNSSKSIEPFMFESKTRKARRRPSGPPSITPSIFSRTICTAFGTGMSRTIDILLVSSSRSFTASSCLRKCSVKPFHVMPDAHSTRQPVKVRYKVVMRQRTVVGSAGAGALHQSRELRRHQVDVVTRKHPVQVRRRLRPHTPTFKPRFRG